MDNRSSFVRDNAERLREFYPSHRDGPKKRGEPGTFEIAIMMAGAISAGAYTAGVMDFLIEALDAWNAAKADDDAHGRTGTGAQSVPHHNVVVRMMTGASAGGMNGAIAAAALDFTFPHIYDERKYAVVAGPGASATQRFQDNPFYDAWVNQIDILPMLNTNDVGKGTPFSLLNCGVLQNIASRIVAFNGPMADPTERAWLLNPYELRLTVTNLRGVPYAYDLKAEAPDAHQGFLMHADHMAFAVRHGGAGPTGPLRPDCIELTPAMPRQAADWQKLGTCGLATGAFPIALQARDLERNADDYVWRHSYYDLDQDVPVFANPAWPPGTAGSTYAFANSDGGVMNNEPFEIARASLAGPRGLNPQGGKAADRAVIVIDPFVEDPNPGPNANADIFMAANAILSAWKNQTRMSMQDLIELQREDVYSRYMIAPSRTARDGSTVFGQTALATSSLSAFGGFFCEGYRHHDFLLGRRNAQRFLSNVFLLPEDNPLFDDGRWTTANKDMYGRDTPRQLPAIPLCGHLLTIPEPTPAWPRGAHKASHDKIMDAVDRRVKTMLTNLAPALLQKLSGPTQATKPNVFQRIGRSLNGWMTGTVASLAASKMSNKIETAARNEIEAAFADIDARPFN